MWRVYLLIFFVTLVVSLVWANILTNHDDEQKNKPTNTE